MLDKNSVTWRYAGDARALPFLGRAFLLQAAHPTIGAGVADFSSFKADPFGRFQSSYGLVLDVIYAADGEQVGADVRAAHRSIKGVKPDGARYHAYEPEAYWWVLATGFEGFASLAGRFLPAMRPGDRERLYEETRELGFRFGLRDRDMQATLPEFDDWYAWMLRERIADNQTVRDVLETLRRPLPPAGLPGLLWAAPRLPVARLAWVTTVGTLPDGARERLGIEWSRRDAAELALLAQAWRRLYALPASPFRLPPAREAYAREPARPTLVAA